MEDSKLHVEIGMDGEKTVSVLKGESMKLMAAAARIVNIFWQAFEKEGQGEFFKKVITEALMQENSPVWAVKD